MEQQQEYITPEAEAVLTPEVVSFVKTESYQISNALETLEVKTPDDDKRAVELGLSNKQALKRIEAFRVAIVQPLNDHVKKLNDVFKKISEPFLTNDSIIKTKRDEYIRENERRVREENNRIEAQRRKEQEAIDEQHRKEQEKLNKKAEKKGVEPVVLAPATVLPPAPKVQAVKTVHTSIGRSTIRKVMKYEIIDESLLPREYLIADEKKIGRRVRDREIKELAGVRIWEENSQTF